MNWTNKIFFYGFIGLFFTFFLSLTLWVVFGPEPAPSYRICSETECIYGSGLCYNNGCCPDMKSETYLCGNLKLEKL